MAATRVQTKGSVKASGITFLVIGILAIIVAGIILGLNAGYMIKGECENLQDYITGGKPFPTGEYVNLDVRSVLGNYAETKHTTNGIPTGTDQYFVIWLDDDSFMSLKVKDKDDVELLNKISDETWTNDDWYSNSTFKATGKLKESIGNSEIKGFYQDFFDEFCEYMGISYSDLTSQFNVREYELDCTDSKSSLWAAVAVLGILGLIFALLGIFTIKKAASMSDTPDMSYSNSGYTPVDTSVPYNPVDTSVPYNPEEAAPEQKISFSSFSDPNANAGYSDPNAGYSDPNANAGYSDPNAGYYDPNNQNY